MLKFLNEVTIEELAEIRKLSALFFTASEIAEMLELDAYEFCSLCIIPGNKYYEAFKGGYYEGVIDLRTGIMKMAKAGSTPAQTAALDLLKKSILKQ